MNPAASFGHGHAALFGEGLADGTVDAIATDHAPLYPENKDVEFIYAAFGVTGLETAIAVIDRALVRTGVLAWNDAVRAFSPGSARDPHVPEGRSLRVRRPIYTVYNPDSPWRWIPNHMCSKSVNTPYLGGICRPGRGHCCGWTAPIESLKRIIARCKKRIQWYSVFISKCDVRRTRIRQLHKTS